jgi:hypothetical protein
LAGENPIFTASSVKSCWIPWSFRIELISISKKVTKDDGVRFVSSKLRDFIDDLALTVDGL